MVKNKKIKSGLQKDVSTIFKGVVIPRDIIDDDLRQSDELILTKSSYYKKEKQPAPKDTINVTDKPFAQKHSIKKPEKLSISKQPDIKKEKPLTPKDVVNVPDKPSILKRLFKKPEKSALLLHYYGLIETTTAPNDAAYVP